MSLPPIDDTHDPARRSWIASAHGHPQYPIQNLPLGVFEAEGKGRPGLAIGDEVLDLAAAAKAGLLPDAASAALYGETLNALFALPAADRLALRRRLSDLLSEPGHRAAVEPLLRPAAGLTMRFFFYVWEYTDFYAGIHHATNVGRQFRPDAPLLPNYKHVPIGYHGRASSVRPSGTPVVRPNGQRKPRTAKTPDFGPSRRLDYEQELGVWIGLSNPLGEPVPIGRAAEHIVGVCLLNDWYARDLQAWEYQPLGPFLAKSFLTTVSPWVVTAEALAPFRIAQPLRPPGDPQPLDYLWDAADQASGALGVEVETHLATAAMREAGAAPHRLSRSPLSSLYWTIGQMLAHHTSNGCNLSPGDLLGTGTISAPTDDGWGSLLEISRGGAEPLALSNGETRAFLEDGDEVILTARAHADGFVPIGFGTCRGVVSAARPMSPGPHPASS